MATTLISMGAARMIGDALFEGLIIFVAGVALLFTREYLKFHRWHDTSYWRNKGCG